MLKLTAMGYDAPIMINTALVTSVEPSHNAKGEVNGTIIHFDNGNDVQVSESFAMVGSLWPALS